MSKNAKRWHEPRMKIPAVKRKYDQSRLLILTEEARRGRSDTHRPIQVYLVKSNELMSSSSITPSRRMHKKREYSLPTPSIFEIAARMTMMIALSYSLRSLLGRVTDLQEDHQKPHSPSLQRRTELHEGRTRNVCTNS